MFRYERPQTGRYRQFHQIGVEALGSNSVYLDLEIIGLGLALLRELGLGGLSLHINSLGTSSVRAAYREALVAFLSGVESQVCEDCKRRMSENPLRVLDCKVPEDQALYAKAPLLSDYYDDESRKIWTDLLAGLRTLSDIEIIEDPKLVRGLDYYNHCVFEIKSKSTSLGQQSTVLAGGRYDGLVSTLGGPETPAAGWALGIERLALLLEEARGGASAKASHGFYIVSDDTLAAAQLANDLRNAGVVVEYDYDNTKVGKQIEKAAKRNARYVIFYLADERSSGSYKIKDLSDASECSVGSIAGILELVGSKPVTARAL
jgi:histidyl-tRNA synthetase